MPTNNPPGGRQPEVDFRKLDEKPLKPCGCTEAEQCEVCRPPQSWFRANAVREVPPDEVMIPLRNPIMYLKVTYLNGAIRWYETTLGSGWHVDTTDRCLIIGKGAGRIHVPLDTVESFSPERGGNAPA